MERTELIKISIYCNGEYSKIVECIKDDNYKKPEVLNIDISGVNAITIFDEEYPKEFFELKYPPFVIYYKGNIDLLKSKKISMVGSRNIADVYFKNATRDLCYKFNSEGTVVVSGLAKGIDAIAHTFAQKSIGVLGCGIDHIYPLENESLFHKLETCGLIISEYPGNSKPLAFHFPFRNRITAALGKCLYVMHVNQKSGTMTTINEAIELNKNIKVLPCNIYSDCYNNTLISEGTGVITNVCG